MGLFVSCCKGEATEYNSFSPPPNPEERRKQMAEAAEMRMKSQEGRGVKDPEALKQRQRRQEELERKQESMGNTGGGGLRWQMD